MNRKEFAGVSYALCLLRDGLARLVERKLREGISSDAEYFGRLKRLDPQRFSNNGGSLLELDISNVIGLFLNSSQSRGKDKKSGRRTDSENLDRVVGALGKTSLQELSNLRDKVMHTPEGVEEEGVYSILTCVRALLRRVASCANEDGDLDEQKRIEEQVESIINLRTHDVDNESCGRYRCHVWVAEAIWVLRHGLGPFIEAKMKEEGEVFGGKSQREKKLSEWDVQTMMDCLPQIGIIEEKISQTDRKYICDGRNYVAHQKYINEDELDLILIRIKKVFDAVMNLMKEEKSRGQKIPESLMDGVQTAMEAIVEMDEVTKQSLGDVGAMKRLEETEPVQDSQKSDEEVVKWYLLAAEGGNASAQYELGRMHDEGRGVAQSTDEAAKWYCRSARAGNALAMYHFGRMHEEGRGVPQSDDEAVKWYCRSARAGNALAMYHLGRMHEEGRGVAQSDDEAVKWYGCSAEVGNAQAQYHMGRMYEEGRGVAQSDDEAVRRYCRSARAGNALAMFHLGRMREEGLSVLPSDKKAVRWYCRSARAGNGLAQYHVGRMYEGGRGVPQSNEEAVKWYRRGAEAGNAQAQYHIGRMLEERRGAHKIMKRWYSIFRRWYSIFRSLFLFR